MKTEDINCAGNSFQT